MPPGNPPANPAYTQNTAGSIDAMPFFSSDGGTLYFSSDRGSPGNPGPWSIYSVTYPSTPSTPLNTLATPPAGYNDFAPTVTADSSAGSTLDFIQCLGAASPCTLEEETLSPTGAPTDSPVQISTGTCPAPAGPLSSTDGQANRPEFNPTNPNQLVYVGVNSATQTNNIYLLTINALGNSCTDLSSNAPTVIPSTRPTRKPPASPTRTPTGARTGRRLSSTQPAPAATRCTRSTRAITPALTRFGRLTPERRSSRRTRRPMLRPGPTRRAPTPQAGQPRPTTSRC